MNIHIFYYNNLDVLEKPVANKAAGNEYKAPEYYQHNTFSYYDYEVIMESSRLPQPSSMR